MNLVKTTVLNFLKENSNIYENHYIIAVSGGVDSTVLLDILMKSNLNISIAHCDFMLREDSFKEKDLLFSIAKQESIPFYHKKFNTSKFANLNKKSIQLAARELRYEWFDELLNKSKNNRLLTAHHLDDNVETILYNFIKGTGVRGLIGINPASQKYLRPLLTITKNEILEYATLNNVNFIEDKSNSENKYNRNKIRNKIVPVASQINTNFLHTVNDTIEYFKFIDELLIEKTISIKERLVRNEGDFIKIAIKDLNSVSKYILFEIFKDFNFTAKSFFQFLDSVKNNSSGAIYNSSTHQILVDRKDLIITEKKASKSRNIIISKNQVNHAIELPENKLLMLSFKEHTNTKQSQNIIKVDFNLLKFPLKVRKWQNGDYFYPIGLGHRQKLKKYFTNNKFSILEKSNTEILVNGDGSIIWIVGHRLDDRFKVTDNTKEILEISLLLQNF